MHSYYLDNQIIMPEDDDDILLDVDGNHIGHKIHGVPPEGQDSAIIDPLEASVDDNEKEIAPDTH